MLQREVRRYDALVDWTAPLYGGSLPVVDVSVEDLMGSNGGHIELSQMDGDDMDSSAMALVSPGHKSGQVGVVSI